MRLHVITPCTRPENLGAVGASLLPLRTQFLVAWHILLSDGTRPHCAGGWERNQVLDSIAGGWVWCLDDDNLCHPRFGDVLAAAIRDHPRAAGFVFDQLDAGGRLRLRADAAATVRGVDAANFVFRREAIGDRRFPPVYESDGYFFGAVRDSLQPGSVVAVSEPVTIYNALRPPPENPR